MRIRRAHLRPLIRALALAALAASPGPADAAGPFFVNGAGEPLRWDPAGIPWNPDQGSLGTLGEAEAVDLVASSFAVWTAVPTAALSVLEGAALSVDVTAANVGAFVGVCNDGVSPVVFDADGSITDALFGVGASSTVFGFAGPECGTFAPAVVTEASAVLNGRFIDGIDTANNPEVGLEAFRAVFVHELGHYLNLDHSQVSLAEAFDGIPTGDDAIATMFPFLVHGAEAATLAKDDVVAISALYPDPGFATTTAALTGRVLLGDGVTPFQGAFVIARNLADPRRDAVGFVSGGRYFPTALGGVADPALKGLYELPGLTAGALYTVEVEQIFPAFTGASSVGPLGIPATLPAPPEFWSGDDEAASNPPDDPTAPGVAIAVMAGVTRTGVDVVLNVALPPPNDGCAGAVDVTSLPFAATLDTRAATTAADDPPQPCAPSVDLRNSNSVWYRIVAPGDGALRVSTLGSSFDTVVSAHTGLCGLLGPVGCGDDQAGPQSVLTFPVSAGTAYLVAVTDFGAPGGGILELAVTFQTTAPPSCTVAEPGACVPGLGSTRTDCLTEWLLEPTPPTQRARNLRTNVPTSRVQCRDGDPRCDFDAVPGSNGRCIFHVAVCVNNHDPRAATAGCSSGPLASYLVLSPSARHPRDPVDTRNLAALTGALGALGAPPLGADACTAFQELEVPVGNRASGVRTLRTRAVSALGKRDADRLRLECLR